MGGKVLELESERLKAEGKTIWKSNYSIASESEN